jgi:hypothetical protein
MHRRDAAMLDSLRHAHGYTVIDGTEHNIDNKSCM